LAKHVLHTVEGDEKLAERLFIGLPLLGSREPSSDLQGHHQNTAAIIVMMAAAAITQTACLIVPSSFTACGSMSSAIRDMAASGRTSGAVVGSLAASSSLADGSFLACTRFALM